MKLIIFDLDGTIADTSEGILNSHRYANKAMSKPIPSDETLYKVIGASLLESYRNVFQFSDEEAIEAVKKYRTWYAEYGIHQVKLYPGIEDLLKKINERGILADIATLKAERFAVTMMKELGISNLFHMIYGMNDSDTLTKAELIRKCISNAGVKSEETCMVGDSIYDFHGAQKCGVSFIGVSYGFGFRNGEKYPFLLCSSPAEIAMKMSL